LGGSVIFQESVCAIEALHLQDCAMRPAMPAVIPSVKMGPRASLSWGQRTTPATASLDSVDSTVAPTLMSVRKDLVLRTLLVKMGLTHSGVCAAMAMTHPTALRQLATMKILSHK